MHMRDPGKLSNSPKWLKSSLKHYLQLKTEEEDGEVDGASKQKKVILKEMEKQMSGKQVFAGPAGTMDTGEP